MIARRDERRARAARAPAPRAAACASRFAPLLLALVAASCRSAPQPASQPTGASSVVERGPYRLEVRAAPPVAWFGDDVTIEVRVDTPPDVLVRFPAVDAFGDLKPTVVAEPLPAPRENGGLVWTWRLRAALFSAGKIEVPPLAVRYAAATPDGSEPDFVSELVSEPVSVEVRSALTSQDSPIAPRDITGTLAPPPAPPNPWTIAALASLAAAVIAAAVFTARWMMRRRNRPLPPIAPEIWALRALAELSETPWDTPERPREFYYRLTGIVRVYIERKFGLAAPEMTTEEFLLRLARDRDALPYEAARLQAFLRACDLVKYAALEPRREDGQQALGIARAFVDATAAAAQTAAAATGGQAA